VGGGAGVGVAGGEEEVRGGAVVVVGGHGEHFGSVEQCQYCARPISGTRILLARGRLRRVPLGPGRVFLATFPVCDTIAHR
jgi:hypothetical protein